MEKFSKATDEFFKSIGDVEPPEEQEDIKSLARVAKMVTRPEKIPKALIAYGLLKEAEHIKEDINPITLKNILVDEYAADWLEWVPENLDHHLLRGQKSDILSNKAQALRICLTTDTPWREWHIFENVGKAFNHQVPNFGLLQPLSLGECETTMRVMKELRSDESFTNEVLIYIAARAFTEHYVYLPKDWAIAQAQPFLDTMIYDMDLKSKVANSWERVKSKKLLNAKFKEDDAVHRQLADLAVVQQYIEEHNGRN